MFAQLAPYLDLVSQYAIFIGAVAILFIGNGSRWGFVFGLCAQPFWLYTSYTHQQWGIVFATAIYTFGWCRGIYRTFIKKEQTITSA